MLQPPSSTLTPAHHALPLVQPAKSPTSNAAVRVGSPQNLPPGAHHAAHPRQTAPSSRALTARGAIHPFPELNLRPSRDKGAEGLCKIDWPSRRSPASGRVQRHFLGKRLGRPFQPAADDRRDIQTALAHLRKLEPPHASTHAAPGSTGQASGREDATGMPGAAAGACAGLSGQDIAFGAGREGIPQGEPAGVDTDTLEDTSGTEPTEETHDTHAAATTLAAPTEATPGEGNAGAGLDPTIPLTIGVALAQRLLGSGRRIDGDQAFELLQSVVDLGTGEPGETDVPLAHLRLLIGGLATAWPYSVKEYVAREWLESRVGAALSEIDIAVAHGLGLSAGLEGLDGLRAEATSLAKDNQLSPTREAFLGHLE